MIACMLAAAGFSAADAMSRMRYRRRRELRERLGERYLRTLVRNLYGDGCEAFPETDRRGARMLLAEIVAALCTVTCGYDRSRMQRIVESEGLDELLLREVRRGGRYRRVRGLRLMARMPLGSGALDRVGRLRGDRDVRICKLLIRMNHAPEGIVSELEQYREPLTPFEFSEAFATLRYGVVPVAFDSMTGSSNRNVKLLGFFIVRHLGAEEAADMLYEHLSSPLPEIREAAMLTLSSLRLPLSDPNVVAAVVAMDDRARRRLYRRLVADGYSLRALAPLTISEGGETGRYVERMIRSYKKTIPRPSL